MNIKPSTYVFQKKYCHHSTGKELDSWQCVQPRRPRGSGGDSVDKMPLRVLVHLSLPHTQERLNFANQNQTFGASFCVKLRQVDPILLLLCILCGKWYDFGSTMSWRSIRINQFSSCAFCVEDEFCVENDFDSTTSWKSILHLNTYSLLLCILCRKWFWKWYFESTITWGTILHLSTKINPLVCIFFWKMILNQRSAEEPCYIWAPNQFTIPLSLHRSHSHLFFTLFPVVFSSRIRFLQVVWWRFFNRFMAEDAHNF